MKLNRAFSFIQQCRDNYRIEIELEKNVIHKTNLSFFFFLTRNSEKASRRKGD